MSLSIRVSHPIWCVVLAAIPIVGTKHAFSSSLTITSAFVTSAVVKQSLDDGQNEGNRPASIKVGGQQVVRLTRKASQSADTPEFLSATILPGRGMNLFQITAKLPGKGIVNLLASPRLEESAQSLDDGSEDSHGVHSFAFGGAFLVPYPNRIRGKLTPDGKNIQTHWKGKLFTLPAVWKGKAIPNAETHAIYGLILDRKTDELKVRNSPEGPTVTGIIHGGDFDGHWLSNTDLIFTITLAGKALEEAISARNAGNESEPMGIGWQPYFATPSGDRKQARLHVPATEIAEVNNYDDVFPTGKLIPVDGTKYDFEAPDGKALENIFLDGNFSRLARTDGNVVVDLTDPACNYGLYIQGLSSHIKTAQVYAPPDKPFVAIEEQFNFADPFGSACGDFDTGMVTLNPGQAVTWTVRLELFNPSK